MARRPRRQPCALALVAALGLGVAGCGGSGGGEACGPTTREALDPAYLVHVLGDDESVEYTSDPPTSGPHMPSPPVEGVLDEPLSPALQVGVLERGDVLLQHDPDLSADDRAQLEEVAGSGVVVAPNPELPAPVVATAWLFKRTCEELDVGALKAFIDERRGKGPE
jgi:hypothetical protein